MNRPITRLLRPVEVLHRLGVSRSQLHRMERAGDFPTRFYLRRQASGWLEEEVDRWLLDRASRRAK
jgi:prophage regulatory protein